MSEISHARVHKGRSVLLVNETPGALPDADELITQHMPLVAHVVRETLMRVPAHVTRDDLTSAGLLALVQAARAFDPARGVPFASYARTRIRGAVLDELRSVDWASRSVRRRERDLGETRAKLAHSLGRVPTDAEVASATGMPIEELSRHGDDVARAQVLSLQGAEEVDLEQLLPSGGPTPDQVLEHRERLEYMTDAVAELPERLRTVVEQYFLAERPMAEIAEALGVTESRVSQMRAEALVLLRGALHRELEPELAPVPERVEGCAARRREAYYAAVAARHTAALDRPRTIRVLDETA